MMNVFLWLIFIAVAIISFVPLAYLKVFNSNRRYHYFKYVSLVLGLWTIDTWLRLVVDEPYLQYYLSLNLYPIVIALVGLLVLALRNYLGKETPRFARYFFWLFVIADAVIANTNAFHHLMWDLAPSANITYLSTINAPNGVFFYIHTALSYFFLLDVIILLVSYLYRNLIREQDVLPFLFITLGLVVGLGLNFIHIFFYRFLIDPTYIAFSLLIFIFYIVVYIRDIKLILVMGRNEFILDNLREMYVVVNQRDEIIDASEEFIKNFGVNPDERTLFVDVMKSIEDKVSVFNETKGIRLPFDEKKTYLHMQMKEISIPLFKYTGKFYLFYDETEHQRYINDMNYIKSHDLMTGLFNRNHFEEIKDEIDQLNRSYALIMFDLDGLKLYNDYLGHAAGDNLLIGFSNKLKVIAKKYNLIPIRMGGDEFLLIAMSMNSKMIDSTIDDIIAVLKSQEEEDMILFSYGYAEREAQYEKIERVFSRADDVMYSMKDKNKHAKELLEEKLKDKACKMNR
ncbi:MAG TPA: diguanylate cyclase [Bacillota bacterium]|mgnify:CR=1 FL=1|nr:diguanylate cyclase [Bacillota bacterium]